MFRDDCIAGSWSGLAARLDRSGTLARWAGPEPALAALAASGVSGLPSVLARGTDPARADEVLGALVRWGAVDGRDDVDAALVVVHLLHDGVLSLASRLRDLSADALALVVGELAAQVRGFPCRRRTHAFAASLLLDTRAALLRELLPGRTRARTKVDLVLVDPTDAWAVEHYLGRRTPGPAGEPQVALDDLLKWAADQQVVTERDLAVLRALARPHRDGPGWGRLGPVARELGVGERTVRRRRDRALCALRAERDHYLKNAA